MTDQNKALALELARLPQADYDEVIALVGFARQAGSARQTRKGRPNKDEQREKPEGVATDA